VRRWIEERPEPQATPAVQLTDGEVAYLAGRTAPLCKGF